MNIFKHFLAVTSGVADKLKDNVERAISAMLTAKDANDVISFDGNVYVHGGILGHEEIRSRGKIILTASAVLKRNDGNRDEVLTVDVVCTPMCFIVKAIARPEDDDPRGVTRELHTMLSTANTDDVLMAVDNVIYQAIAGNLEQ